jgi:hypothetical protein
LRALTHPGYPRGTASMPPRAVSWKGVAGGRVGTYRDCREGGAKEKRMGVVEGNGEGDGGDGWRMEGGEE